MNEDILQLVQSFFGKDSIDDCNLQELQNATREYPYSAPLQLILSEKMRSQHPSLYQKQLQKTSLYFHNILWFDYLVNKEEYFQEDFIISLSSQKKGDTEMETDETLLNGETWSYEDQVQVEEIKTEIIVEQALPETETAPLQILETSTDESDILQTYSDPVEQSQINLDEENQPVENQDDQADQIALILKIEPAKEEASVPAFEPYHTVDYFASQGIKFTQDEKPKDRFGQQLKSFTEWLKTMKRLPQAEIARNVDAGSEQKVQSLAEHSLQEPEVVTEAMAEVWEKQGNRQKAVELYTKLSLLNPGKSSYFAAKIEQLKKEMP